MTTDHTNDGTFTRDEVSQAMDYAREHGDSRIVDDEGVTRLSFHVPHLDDPPHEPGCNCGESSECPTYAPGLPTLTPEAPPAHVDVMAYYRVLPCDKEADGWYIDVDPPHGMFRTREEAKEHCARHLARVLAGCAQPTEPPPLPGGWTMERSVHGAIPEDIPCTCYDGFEGDYVVVMDDGRVHADAMVGDLLHLLGLTAPVADVRALELLAAYDAVTARIHGAYDSEQAGRALAEGLRALLTGKGAPL